MPKNEVEHWADTLRNKYGIPEPQVPGSEDEDCMADYLWEYGRQVLLELFGDADYHLSH